MKKIYLLFALQVCFYVSSNAQWTNVGAQGISPGMVSYPGIAIDNSNTPYIVYQDVANYGQFVVEKFNGTNWVNVGTPQWSTMEDQAYQESLAINSSGTPYVFCTDDNYGTVRKFDGANWVFVGDSQFIQFRPDNLQITIAANGTPYVAYSNYYNNEIAGVMKFDGQKWDTVGSQQLNAGKTAFEGIACDGNSTPYLVLSDDDQQEKATVLKFNGSTWVSLGTPGFTSDAANYVCIAIDHNNTPYIAYSAATTSGMNVMKYNGSSWVYAGNSNFATFANPLISLAIDKNNVPYVSFIDSSSNQASVMKLSGNTWTYVGNPDFSDIYISSLGMALAPSTGTPYVVFSDANIYGAASVMKYGGSTGVENVSSDITLQLFPNPAANLLQINAGDMMPDAICIFDVNGQKVFQGKYARQVDISGLVNGVYFIQLTNATASVTQRFVKI